MIKFLTFATTRFSLKLVVDWRRLPHFPAKMTLVRARALLSIEKATQKDNLVRRGFFFQLTWILNCIKLISWGGLNVQGVALFVCECIKNIQCHSNKTSVWFILYLVVVAYRSMWFWLAHSKQHVNNWSKGDRVKIVFSCYISRCMSCRLPRNHCACLK